jgi:hypothetical protein
VKAFEESVFGPCTLGRTWGTRPEPSTVSERSSLPDLSDQFGQVLEEGARYLLRYVSGFLSERVVARARGDSDSKDLIADAANDLLSIGLAFDVRGTHHCLIPNSL